MTERKRFRSALIVVLMLPVLYFFSLGPVVWLKDKLDHDGVTYRYLDAYSFPADSLITAGYGDWISNYLDLWAPSRRFQAIEEALL